MNVHYRPATDYAKENNKYQGISPELSEKDAIKVAYPGTDNLQNATLNDNYIYISTHDAQHTAIERGESLSSDAHTNLSGYFTSEGTAKDHINSDGTFDSYSYHRASCVAPYNGVDKGHLDCFQIDRDRMEAIYGTRDFNAAIGKCNANNQYGPDGADQGYNSSLNELYNNGCLKYAGTHDAVPGSTTMCQKDLSDMQDFRTDKINAILSGKSADDIQKIGHPLNEKCHQDTAFNAEPRPNLTESYANHTPQYNRDVAGATTNNDRLAAPFQSYDSGSAAPSTFPSNESTASIPSNITAAPTDGQLADIVTKNEPLHNNSNNFAAGNGFSAGADMAAIPTDAPKNSLTGGIT